MLPNMPTAFLSCTMQQHLDQYAKLFTYSIQFCHLCPPFPYHVHIQLFAIYAHLLFISLAFCHICILHTFSYHLTGNNFCLVHCTCTMYSTVCLKYSRYNKFSFSVQNCQFTNKSWKSTVLWLRITVELLLAWKMKTNEKFRFYMSSFKTKNPLTKFHFHLLTGDYKSKSGLRSLRVEDKK
jgi:hypothetical protein